MRFLQVGAIDLGPQNPRLWQLTQKQEGSDKNDRHSTRVHTLVGSARLK